MATQQCYQRNQIGANNPVFSQIRTIIETPFMAIML